MAQDLCADVGCLSRDAWGIRTISDGPERGGGGGGGPLRVREVGGPRMWGFDTSISLLLNDADLVVFIYILCVTVV
jgi:hypothetical protein